MANQASAGPGEAGATLEAAHRGLLGRKDLQFDFQPAQIEPRREPPGWLRRFLSWLSDAFDAAAPVVHWLFWGLVALAVLGLLFLIVREVGGFDWLRRRKKGKTGEAEYRPTAELAQALLDDADALAAQGRFAEAVHVLLLRSIEDVDRWRPRLIRPSLTSRDIEGLEVLPAEARGAFSAMARLVETSLFGGRPVDADGFAESRRAYQAFAFPQVWA